MKIISLNAENIKKLVAVEIKPDGNLVQITGKNGNGKTSVLDSLWWALSGASTIQGKPIREGQSQARIRLDLGEIVVTRKFKAKADGDYTTSISVENAEGVKFPSPQVMIDGLLGQLTFDPLAFVRMSPKEQFNALRQFVPDVDFDAIEMENKADYTERTEINRQIKAAMVKAEAIQVLKDAPEPVNEKALLDELEAAGKHNGDIEIRKSNRARMKADVISKRKEFESLNEQISMLRIKADKLALDADDLDKKLNSAPPLPDPIDISGIRTRIDEAKKVSDYLKSQDERRKHLKEIEDLEKHADSLTASMDKRESDKRAKIAAAKLPVSGIGFGDGVVMLNGQPFEQASDAEGLRASIAIAMALNPKLRVIRVRDGSLLDEGSMKLLEEMAVDKDFQVWVETVNSSGKVGFYMEEGSVKSINGASTALEEGDAA